MSLSRRAPLRRKAPQRGKPKRASCAVLRCSRRPYVGGELCITHAKRRADQLFSLYVRARDGRCMVALLDCASEVRCNGGLQAMHLVPRGYLATRYDPSNVLAGCAAHHTYLTHHPLEHWDFCETVLGPLGWRSLRAKAMSGARPDYAAIIALYSEEAA